VAFWKERLIGTAVASARAEKLLVDFGIIESRHRSAIKPQCARGHDQVGALQGTVAGIAN
jgi:hypothetical protein